MIAKLVALVISVRRFTYNKSQLLQRQTFLFLTVESRGKVHQDNRADTIRSSAVLYTWEDACRACFK